MNKFKFCTFCYVTGLVLVSCFGEGLLPTSIYSLSFAVLLFLAGKLNPNLWI